MAAVKMRSETTSPPVLSLSLPRAKLYRLMAVGYSETLAQKILSHGPAAVAAALLVARSIDVGQGEKTSIDRLVSKKAGQVIETEARKLQSPKFRPVLDPPLSKTKLSAAKIAKITKRFEIANGH
jgi:hypothetical protein